MFRVLDVECEGRVFDLKRCDGMYSVRAPKSIGRDFGEPEVLDLSSPMR